MKSTVFIGFLSTLVVCAESLDFSLSTETRPNVVPNKFIIEVEHTASLDRRGDVIHPLNTVFHQIKSRDIPHQVIKEFKMDGIFHGAVLKVNNAKDVGLIENTPGVKAVRPVAILSVPRLAKYPLIWKRADAPPDTFSSHILTGVDKVHAEGNIGSGVKIGIIDSGIDYNHPVLGSNGFGPNKKIVTGYDFVGDDYMAPNPGPDPKDCNGLGTHVAGIIAAQPDNPYNISGVAYGATLGAYRVFDCNGHTSDDIVIEALDRGVKDGMDILTLSFGTEDCKGWATTTVAVVADRIAQSGKIMTIEVGDNGNLGSWCVSSPATGNDVISVGSVDNTVIPLQNATVHGVDHPPITYLSSFPLNITGSLPIYATSTNTLVEDDACSPLAQDTPDLSKYLVVIRLGTCEPLTKLNNVAAKGANAMLIYNNGTEFFSMERVNYTASFIQAADGEFLVKQFVAGAPITISFPQVGGATNLPDDHGGLMSSFSSYGPSFDFGFKPSFAAPGGNILSTYPVALGSFAVLSGTSMSSSFAAGAAALLLSAKTKSLSAPNGTRTLLETTSTKLIAAKNHSGYDTLIKAGAGLINVYNAIHATTIVSPGELILNDTAHFHGNHTIVIQNIGDTAKDYTLKHIPAFTSLTMKEKSILPALGPVPISTAAATVVMEPVNFTVQASGSQQVAISFQLPTTLDASWYPVYSGFVEVTSGSESYHASYIGLGASLKDHRILDNTTEVVQTSMPLLYDQNGTVTELTNYTFLGEDFPWIAYRLAMGTPMLYVDLLDPDKNFIGILESNDHFPRSSESPKGPIFAYKPELHFMNNTKIPNGSYRLRLRILKITGDPFAAEDYEWWESVVFGIQA